VGITVKNEIEVQLLKKRLRFDPRTKSVIVLIFLTSVLYSSNIYLLGSLAVFSLFLAIIVRARVKFIIISLFFLSLFSLIATLLANITLTVENVYFLYAIIVCRFTTSFLIISWFFYSVEPYELAISLEKMYIPAMLVWFIITIYQFVPITARKAQEINDIRKIKGLTAKKWEIRKQIYIFRKTLKPLITDSINRGIDLAESMTIKGFVLKRRKNLYLDVRIRLLDIISILFSIAALVLVILYLK